MPIFGNNNTQLLIEKLANFGLKHLDTFRLKYTPFTVIVVLEVPGLYPGDIVDVTAIKMDMKLIDIYIVGRKAYYYYNFVLFTLNIYPDFNSISKPYCG